MASSAKMPSCLPPQLVMTWLPIRDVASALNVAKDWCSASEPLFQAIAARHGCKREETWKAAVRTFFSYNTYPVDWNPKNDELRNAVQRNDVPAIQTLIGSGANPSYANYSQGQTPLHIAAIWANVDALNTLIAAGAEVNAQNRFLRHTPLHISMYSTHRGSLPDREACVRRLLEAGANARLLDSEENAPYQVPLLQGEDPNNRLRKLLEDAFRAQRQ